MTASGFFMLLAASFSSVVGLSLMPRQRTAYCRAVCANEFIAFKDAMNSSLSLAFRVVASSGADSASGSASGFSVHGCKTTSGLHEAMMAPVLLSPPASEKPLM
jgi:hypothetical protein